MLASLLNSMRHDVSINTLLYLDRAEADPSLLLEPMASSLGCSSLLQSPQFLVGQKLLQMPKRLQLQVFSSQVSLGFETEHALQTFLSVERQTSVSCD